MTEDAQLYPNSRDILAVQGQGYQSFPSLAAGGTITSSASANTYGSYTQIGSVNTPFAAWVVGVHVGPQATAPIADEAYLQYALAIGPSGSEIQISEWKLFGVDFISGVGVIEYPAFFLPFPILVPGGSRVAARSASSNATAMVQQVSLIIVKYEDLVRLP